jgi:hypothetical protein
MAFVYASGALNTTGDMNITYQTKYGQVGMRGYVFMPPFPGGAVSGVLDIAGKVNTIQYIFASPIDSAVRIGMPYKSLSDAFAGVHEPLMNPSGVGLFIRGGHETSTTLYTIGGPLYTVFDSLAVNPEGTGLISPDTNRPVQDLYIKGKGTIYNDSLNLHITTPSIIDSYNDSLNVYVRADAAQPTGALASTTLYIENQWSTVATSVAGPSNRASDVPLYLQASPQTINTNMPMFIGPQNTVVDNTTLFMQADEVVGSGTMDMFILPRETASGIMTMHTVGLGSKVATKTLSIRGK